MEKKTVKESVKDKAKAAKGKIKEKLKGAKRACVLFALFAAAAMLTGCQTPNQASRSTNASYDDLEPKIVVQIGEGVTNANVNATINMTLGDGALASADSSGSTESQTQTPTFDIRPQTDLRYNDAIAGASSASKGVLETLADTSKDAVLAMMASKQSGMVGVTKKDGTKATVTCTDGQCSICEDGICTPAKAQNCSGGSCTDAGK